MNGSWAMDQNLPVATSLGPGTSVTGLVQRTLPSLLTCIWLHVTERLAHTAFPLKDVYTAPKEKPQVGLAHGFGQAAVCLCPQWHEAVCSSPGTGHWCPFGDVGGGSD